MESLSPKSPHSKAALGFIFVTVLFDILALGIIIPILPKLVAQFVGNETSKAASIYGLFGTTWALMQFFFSPILGSLSDRFGRRPVILLSNFGLGLDYILMALAPTLGWLFAGRVLSGITAASISTAGAYISDVTPPEKRAQGFGILGAAFGVGFILGPALGGILGSYDVRYPFWAAAVLSLSNALYGYFILPESLAKDRRSAFSWKKANPVGALKLIRSYPGLMRLSAVNFLSFLSHVSLPSTFVLYATFRYGWNERTVGFVLAAVGLTSGIVQGGLVGKLVKRFGEFRILVTGLIFGAIGFAAYGFAPTGFWFFMAIPLMSLWGIAGPALQGIMTKQVGPTEQGQLQGALSSIRGISDLIGPTLFTQTFAYFIHPDNPYPFPGSAFLLSALLLGFAVLVILIPRPTPQPKPLQNS